MDLELDERFKGKDYRCNDCGTEFKGLGRHPRCPSCGSENVTAV
jgi:rubrerythrin